MGGVERREGGWVEMKEGGWVEMKGGRVGEDNMVEHTQGPRSKIISLPYCCLIPLPKAEKSTTGKAVAYFPALTRWGKASLVSR